MVSDVEGADEGERDAIVGGLTLRIGWRGEGEVN